MTRSPTVQRFTRPGRATVSVPLRTTTACEDTFDLPIDEQQTVVGVTPPEGRPPIHNTVTRMSATIGMVRRLIKSIRHGQTGTAFARTTVTERVGTMYMVCAVVPSQELCTSFSQQVRYSTYRKLRFF